MKLRNKKTGKIREYDEEVKYYRKLTSYGHDDWTPNHPEDWEEYAPSEPLIKDEKIRKVVRAWAEADCIKKAYLRDHYTLCKDDDIIVSISFSMPVFRDVRDECEYTIAELCGDEEK